MTNAVRDLRSTQPQASAKLREALAQEQQDEIARDMERNAQYIRGGNAQYAALSELNMTQGLTDLRDSLRAVQQALGPGNQGQPGKDGKGMEQALAQVEQLHQQMLQMQAARGNSPGRGQTGQQGQGQQGQGQQGQGQQGQGQQGQGQQGQGQQGQGQQGGGQPGQGGQQGGQYGGARQNGGPNGGPYGGAYGGGYWGGPGPVYPNFVGAYQGTLQTLRDLQQQFREDPNAPITRDVGSLIRDLMRLDPNAYVNDPLLSERINAVVSADLEQVEIELRRKVDEADGSVRSQGGEAVPEGYANAVQEYFRKLSKSK
jgi:hypothetical protein